MIIIKQNPKACIQVGGSFYQRLINTPILYTNINPHAGSSDGLCSAAIEAGNKDSQDYKENRFKNNTGYYLGNSNFCSLYHGYSYLDTNCIGPG